MKGLSTEEVGLLTEMKDRCLNKGLYIDDNAEKKFKMLCHLEDFSIQYYELQNNWNELKKWLEECLNEIKQNDVYDRTSYEQGQIIALESSIAKVQELEQGKDD